MKDMERFARRRQLAEIHISLKRSFRERPAKKGVLLYGEGCGFHSATGKESTS
jgi:hypothetical protein